MGARTRSRSRHSFSPMEAMGWAARYSRSACCRDLGCIAGSKCGKVAREAPQQAAIEDMARHHRAAMGVKCYKRVEIPPDKSVGYIVPAEANQHSRQRHAEA